MIIHNVDGLKYEVQWSIKTIQTTQHVITFDQLNTTGADLGPAQPQLVLKDSQIKPQKYSYFSTFCDPQAFLNP